MVPLRWVVLAACAFASSACSVGIDLPREFVVLAGFDGGSDYRAITGDDARVWLRRFEDPNEADLEFWIDVLEHDFEGLRGYERTADGTVQDTEGRAGRWFEFVTNVEGERIGYLIAVWAGDGEVLVVEFAARSEIFGQRVESVRAALSTVRG